MRPYSRREFLELALAGPAGLASVAAMAAEPDPSPSMSTNSSSNWRLARKQPAAHASRP